MFTASDIQNLRERTGVGMMDCKKALTEVGGDIEKAIEYLREKGIAGAAKRAGRVAAEGIVDSYIHLGGKVGVLLEVNCETDFVAKGEKFKELVHDIALHIAAAKPEVVNVEDVNPQNVESEKKILREQALAEKKPVAVVEKMVEGRIKKYFEEVVLMEQKFVKNPEQTIKQLVTEAIATIGEKISIRRFVRYEMGEGIEKRKDTFAEEINEQLAKMKK
ncbi:MAG: translation elongation factor Ts [Firmicutes bacterium]|nr:translation elongation factor Ts [Bacillota bacterium]